MCSSYTSKSKTKKEEYQQSYGVAWEPADASNPDTYVDESGENSVGFPGNKMPVITIEKPTLIQDYEFGFIPHWVKSDGIDGYRGNHNAKIETITELPTWRDAWKAKQRCLVCTNGFFEHDKKRKQKVFIRLKDPENFYFAGLYNNWVNKGTGEVRRTMAIITTVPNELVATVHNRMPIIIRPGDHDAWMDISADLNHLLMQYSQPISAAFMIMEDSISKPKKSSQGELF